MLLSFPKITAWLISNQNSSITESTNRKRKGITVEEIINVPCVNSALTKHINANYRQKICLCFLKVMYPRLRNFHLALVDIILSFILEFMGQVARRSYANKLQMQSA